MEAEIRKAVDEAVKALKEGGIILFPTDTVWALGCDASNREAVQKLTSITGIKSNKGMILLVPDMNMVYKYIKEVPEIAEEVEEASDTPLTIIYPKALNVAPEVIADDKSVAIRVVTHPFCTAMLKKFGRAVVTATEGFTEGKYPTLFEEFDDAVTAKLQWQANPMLEAGFTGKPSSILYLGEGAVVKIMRK